MSKVTKWESDKLCTSHGYFFPIKLLSHRASHRAWHSVMALCDDIMEFAKFDDDQQEAYEAYARDLFIDDYYFTDVYVFRR